MSYDAKSGARRGDACSSALEPWQEALQILRAAREERRRTQAKHDVALAVFVAALYCLLWWMGARS